MALLRSFLLLFVAGAARTAAQTLTDGDGAEVSYSVVGIAPSYDAANDQTTFSYEVSTGAPLDMGFTVSSSASCNVVSGAPSSGFTARGQIDAEAGVTGFTWQNSAHSANVAVTYTVVLRGNVASGSSQVELKAGSGVAITKEGVNGPNCDIDQPAPLCQILLDDQPVCVSGSATATVRSEHSAESYSWSSEVGTITGSGHSSVVTFPVDECDEYAMVNLTVTNTHGSQTSCALLLAYNYQNNLGFKSYPADETVEPGSIPAVPDLEAVETETCFAVTIEDSQTQSQQNLPYTLTRTWKLKDQCDSTTVVQRIDVADIVPPTFVSTPPDRTVGCDAIPAPCEVAVADDSDVGLTVGYSESRIDGACDNEYTLVRTWTTSDASNNEAEYVQTITVEDRTNPRLIGVPENIVVECDSIPQMASVTAKDNCGMGEADVNSNQESFDGGLVRTWTVSDACSNTVVKVQTILVTDLTPPRITGVQEGSVTVECDAVPAAPCNVQAIDDCDNEIVPTYTKVSEGGICANQYTEYHHWEAADASGNSASISRTINVVDSNGPEFEHHQAAISLTCSASVPSRTTAVDSCSGPRPIEMTEETIESVQENQYKIVRTYTSMDLCGTESSATTTITVNDDEDPMLVAVPANTTVNCESVPDPANVLAYDNCACDGTLDLTVSYTQVRDDGNCPNRYNLTRTWDTVDCSGNPKSATQVITVVDDEAPTIVPTFQGTAVSAFSSHSMVCQDTPVTTVTATDNCDATVDADFTSKRIDFACQNTYDIVYTYSSTDTCGNSDPIDVTVNVHDSAKPTFFEAAPPASLTYECHDTANINFEKTMTPTDLCDANPDSTFSGSIRVDDECEDKYELHREWSLVDECGNTGDSLFQTIVVQDNTAPTMDCSDIDETLEYYEALPAVPTVTVDDNCDPSIQFTYTPVTVGSRCHGSHTRTWTLSDRCGNPATTCTHTYTFVDNHGPDWTTSPSDLNVDCHSDFPLTTDSAFDLAAVNVNDYSELKYEVVGNHDNTENVTMTHVCTKQTPVECNDRKTYNCIYTARDNCGVASTKSFVVTVHDDDVPQFLPATRDDETSECGAALATPPNWNVRDACEGSERAVMASASSVPVTGEGKIVSRTTYTYSVTDTCGNSDSASYNVDISDNTDPEIQCPEIQVQQCPHEPDVQPTYSDVCDAGPTLDSTSVGGQTAGCSDYEKVFTHTVTDKSGNSAECDVTITVADTTPPVCDAIQSTTEECPFTPSEPSMSCDDNCGGQVTVTDVSTYTAQDIPNGLIAAVEHKFDVTDACGLTETYARTVTVRDTTDPTFDNCPEATTVSCDAPAAPSVTASDTCGSASVEHSDDQPEQSQTCEDYSYTNTWVATDESGLTATCTQLVTVTMDRTLSFGADHSFESTDELGDASSRIFSDHSATNSCGDEVPVVCTTQVDNPECAGGDFGEKVWSRSIYTCTATQSEYGCNPDSVSYVQTVIVIDTTPDTAIAGDDLTEDCAATSTTPAGCVDGPKDCDSCGGTYSFTRTCSTTDVCGNTDDDSALISVVDSEIPTVDMTGLGHTTVECGDDLPTGDPTATDNCGDASMAPLPDVDVDTTSAASNVVSITVRKWSFTDGAGNINTVKQTVTVEDNTDPVMNSCSPYPDTEAENGGADENGDPKITDYSWPGSCSCADHSDTCDGSLDTGCAETRADGTCPGNFYRIHTWTSTDDHGNSASDVYSVLIKDTTPPVFDAVHVPGNQQVDINDIPEKSDALDASHVIDVATDKDGYPLAVSVTHSSTTIPSPSGDPDQFKIVHTWTAEDSCGNTNAVSMTLDVQDLEIDDNIQGVPPNATYECSHTFSSEEIFNPEDVSAVITHWSDNNDVVEGNGVAVPSDCVGDLVETWTWKFQRNDQVNYEASEQNHVQFQDQTPPVLSSRPDNANQNADETCGIPAAAVVTATDACAGGHTDGELIPDLSEDQAYFSSGAVDVQFTETKTPITGSIDKSIYRVTRQWDSTDTCNNPVNHQQVVTVFDNTPPTISFVVDTDSETNVHNVCAAPTFSEVECADNCGCTVGAPDDDDFKAGCDFVYIRKWTATDAVGNEATMSQTFTYTDDSPPTFDNLPTSHPNDRCSALTLVAPTASDNCGTAVVNQLGSDVSIGDKHDFVRSFRATDHCGVTTDGSTTVNLSDTSAPVITAPGDASITCAESVPASVATFTDDCSAESDVSMGAYEETTDEQCGGSKVIIRTWTVNDLYNTDTASQTITVLNDGAPDVATAPDHDTITVTGSVSCDAPTSAANLTASDCGSSIDDVVPSVQQVDDFTTVFTWTVTDACGSENTQSQTIIRVDDDAPVITGTCESSVHACGTEPAACENVECTDNCDATCTVDFTEQRVETGDCAGSAYYVRTWDAQDASGNDATTITQTIQLYDMTAPDFEGTPTSNTQHECDNILDPPTYTATDECSAVATVVRTTTSDQELSALPYNLYYEYRATDDCGNSQVFVQTANIVDNTPPTMPVSPPAAEADDCSDPVYVPVPATAGDNCAGSISSVITVESDTGTTCLSTKVYRHTWTDQGGNEIFHLQTVTREDATPPVLTVDGVVDGETVTSECDRPAAVPASSFTDDCNDGGVLNTVQHAEVAYDCAQSMGGDAECVESYINRWSVADDCGQESRVFQTVIVKDTEGYVVESEPNDEEVDICNYDSHESHAPIVLARDGCSAYAHDAVITNTSTGNPCDAEGMKVTYSYVWTDGHGHTTNGDHVITVKDQGKAALTVPDTPDGHGAVIECDQTFTWLDGTWSKCLAGGNDEDTISPVLTSSTGSCDDQYTSIATWSYTDNCGRLSSEVRSVSVVDTNAPSLVGVPTENTEECHEVTDAATVTVNDACDSTVVVVPTTDRIDGACNHTYKLVHTWTATDACGNRVSEQQTVHVEDNQAPTLNADSAHPDCSTQTIECTQALPDCEYVGADACDKGVVVAFTESTVGDKSSCYTLTRSWYIEDVCGLSASMEQVVTVQDTSPPTIVGPADITVQFPTLPAAHPDHTDHTVTDNCQHLYTPDVECTEVPSGDDCTTLYTRTCTVTDECGLTASHTYTVTVVDTTNPVLYGVPDNFTVEKGEIPEVYTIMSHLSASDAHGLSTEDTIEITADDTSVPPVTNNGVKTVTWIFKAEDKCENSVTQTTVVQEEDNCGPKFNDYPIDQTVECDSVPTACTLTTVNEDLIVSYKQTEESDGRLTRVWTASDLAGNPESHTQVITVQDTVAPILSRYPSDTTVSCCAMDMPSEVVVALDNCDAHIEVDTTDVTVIVDGPQDYLLIRTFSAVDGTPNSVQHIQTIRVEDDAAPTLFPAPEESVSIKCSEVTQDLLDRTSAQATQAIDNCD
jgi:hypothetical protein